MFLLLVRLGLILLSLISDLIIVAVIISFKIICVNPESCVWAAPHGKSLWADSVGCHFDGRQGGPTADISQKYGIGCRTTILVPLTHRPTCRPTKNNVKITTIRVSQQCQLRVSTRTARLDIVL